MIYYFKVTAYNLINTTDNVLPEDNIIFSDVIKISSSIIPSQITSIVQLNNNSNTDILVSWSIPIDNGGSNIIEYILYKESINGSNVFQFIYKGLQTNYIDKDLKPGSYFKYKVTARNISGESIFSPVLISYAAEIPNPILDLKITSVSSSTIALEYSQPYDGGQQITNYYIILESFTIQYTATPIDNLTNLVYLYSVDTNDKGKRNSFIVYSKNIMGFSKYSNEVVTYACDSPDPPSINLLNRIENGLFIEFIPNTNTGLCDITGYSVDIDSGIIGSDYYEYYNGTDIPYKTTLEINNLNLGLTYNIKLSYMNKANLTNFAIQSYLIGTLPSAPYNIDKSSINNSGTLVITWENPMYVNNKVTSNLIFISNNAGVFDNNVFITYTNMLNLQYTFNLLTSGITYKIRMKSINDIGESDFSQIYYFTIASPPDPPVLRSDYVSDGNFLTISWDRPINSNGSNIQGYFFYIFREAIWVKIEAKATYSTISSYKINNLAKGETYRIKISALNVAGESGYSNMNYFICSSTPLYPSEPKLEISTKTSITFTWDPPSDIGGSNGVEYEIFRKEVLTHIWNKIDTVSILSHKYTDNNFGPTPSYAYEYKLRLNTQGINNTIINGQFSLSQVFYLSGVPIVQNKPNVSLGFYTSTGIFANILSDVYKFDPSINKIIALIKFKESDNNGSNIVGYNVYLRDITLNSENILI